MAKPHPDIPRRIEWMRYKRKHPVGSQADECETIAHAAVSLTGLPYRVTLWLSLVANKSTNVKPNVRKFWLTTS
ncbi:hypothetical protein DPMN_180510 [Dreissena polymorpha]|uniref:Uncharacterized protein n=1 Tax=Dreissena polymorpha TaxID=45954 RepID=A0A9D4IKJ0_DREPO|nr:hypothetical protein DPMN_180510 [Dreissena polymorpha]